MDKSNQKTESIPFNKFQIKTKGTGYYDILIDGVEQKFVTAIDIHMKPDCVPTVKLEYVPFAVDVDIRNGMVEKVMEEEK